MNTADDDRIAARRAEAIRLRVRGKTIREIAKELGISRGLAHSDVRAVMAETAKRTAEDVEDERELQILKIDQATQQVTAILEGQIKGLEGYTGADDDDLDVQKLLEDAAELKLKAVDRLLKLEERRAKLLGLDAPARSEVAGSLSVGSADPVVAARLVREAFGAQAVPKVVSESGSQEEAGGIPVSTSGE